MEFKKPDKKNLFRHLKQNIDDSMNGLSIMFKESSTFHRIYLMMIIGGIIFGLIFKFNVLEIIILAGIFIFDVVIETMNSAVEEVCDRITLERDEKIKRSKDIASGAVCIMHFLYIFVILFFVFSHAFGFTWWTHLIPA